LSPAYLQAKITKLEARITATEDAIEAIATGSVEEYRLDTGQTVTNVTKINLATIQKVLEGMYNQLTIMCTRLNGGGSVTVKPAW